jgi:drug/metabolite transporter (DMT)-like permease
MVEVGIIFALVAMLCWGFGDYLIQKSTRKFGDWETLFLIALFGAIVLSPFVYKSLPEIFSSFNKTFVILLIASLAMLIAALFEFEALKEGKISVVEPLWSLEIPMSALLAFFLLKEVIGKQQIFLIALLIVGLVLVSLRSHHLSKRVWLEKGVIIAALSAVLMGVANFFVGFGARLSDALMVNWFFNVVIIIFTGIYLLKTKKMSVLMRDIKSTKGLLAGMCILDNGAWIAFAYAMILAPIAIAVALSESYIIIAVLLGMFVTKEKLGNHQKIGLIIAVISAIILAAITN